MNPKTVESMKHINSHPDSKITSIENLSPAKIINICRGIAQLSIAEANNSLTYRIAHRDNKMIDENCIKIDHLYEDIEDNFESGNESQIVIRENTEIYNLIRSIKQNNKLIKTTRITSDDIRNR